METGRTLSSSSRFIIAFLACIVIFYQTSCYADHTHPCPPSSCGNIRNISNPFRLQTDPDHCGDLRYNLSCENNNTRTVLYLYAGKYYVQAINYINQTIRLVDPNVVEGDCSSIPLYSLSNYNISADWYPGYSSTVYIKPLKRQWSGVPYYYYEEYSLSEAITFLSCENPVKSPLYIPTTPCINTTTHSESKERYSYVHVGNTNVSELKDFCRIEMMFMTSSRRQGIIENSNISYVDIHNQLAYGFELLWYPRSSDCYFNDSSNSLNCIPLNGMYIDILDYLQISLEIVFIYGVPLWLVAKTILGTPCVIGFFIYKWRKRHLSGYDVIEEFLQSNSNLMPIRYSYSNIKKMTKGFKDKLGEGGYGSVYKGKLRSGRLVAIKMLEKTKANGQDFINEVSTIGRIHHVNVVQLVGFCVERSKRALVYDFMSNGSLDKYIYSQEGNNSLDYKKLYEISLGVAQGIEYLHRGCNMQILHFDIKPHNILLDENFVPKVSDFGLARLCPLDKSIVSLTAARGTMGYMAPELFYRNIGGVSYKADVYSFGMLLMEMASRRKNLNAVVEHTSQIYFPSWVYDQLNEGNDLQMEDAITEEESKIRKKMIIVALWCIQMKPSDRPSMNKVLRMLEGEIESLQMPPKPFLCPEQKSVEDVGETSNSKCSSIPSEDDDNEEISLILNSNDNNKFVDVKGKLKVLIC
ncbi:hypothetical protein FNV43_RR24991 [Rhamnella rubrinervis]|uniref:Protein kinase domain-containing protein n=1 Tax=Rhamnella rubrinervis TaxID=2594499 RepID=A0A8K0GR82_9ROSA|nr:hypothetical protein FNV43_RR24991 [Rhamnella rubrinervis]